MSKSDPIDDRIKKKGMMMNIEEIKEIINLMKEHDISEFCLEKDGVKLLLKKDSPHAVGSSPSLVSLVNPSLVSSQQSAGAAAADLNETQKKENDVYEYVRSPMVGTFYRAPSPESPPYVTQGQTVKPGDVLCIIEAMKVMNEIKNEIQGQIVDVLVDNGEPVEFNQPLFKIDPRK